LLYIYCILNNNNEKDPKFQLDCIKELRMLTMTLVNLYKILPGISGFEFQYESDNNQSVLLRKDNEINWTEDERKAFEDKANDSREAKF
jgi:hypothetical protein